jgi:hypothetical protein
MRLADPKSAQAFKQRMTARFQVSRPIDFELMSRPVYDLQFSSVAAKIISDMNLKIDPP